MTIRFHKVVGVLPEVLDADAVYALRTGVGFDLFVTDATGQIAHSVNSGLPGWATPMQPAADPIPSGWYELALLDAGGVAMRLLTQTPPVAPAIPVFVPLDGRMIVSGHSLTDTVMSYPWPGLYHITRESMLGTSLDVTRSAKSTIPGSSAAYRWDDPSDDLQSPNDARHDIALYDGMTITDRGNSGTGVAAPDDADLTLFREDLVALRSFLFNALDNGRAGRATRFAYQTHWADLDGSMGDWRAVTLDYGRRALFRVQWLEYQARQAYADLPGDFRIPVIPGHLLMVRIFDDVAAGLVPGVSSFASLFKDTIHPLEDGGLLDTALAWLFAAVLHGENPVDYPDLAAGAQVTTPQAAYLKPVIWQIASTYRWALLGGADGRGEVGYDPATDPDPLDDGGPVEPGDDLPNFDVLRWTAGGYSGPSLAGPQPTVSGGVLQFRGTTPLSAPLVIGPESYGVTGLQPLSAVQAKAPIIVVHNNATWWQGTFLSLTWNGWLGAGKYLAERSGDITAEPTVQTGASAAVVEWWCDGDSISISVDGGVVATAALPASWGGSAYITLFGQIDNVPEFDVTALGIASALPDETGRAAARAWAQPQ